MVVGKDVAIGAEDEARASPLRLLDFGEDSYHRRLHLIYDARQRGQGDERGAGRWWRRSRYWQRGRRARRGREGGWQRRGRRGGGGRRGGAWKVGELPEKASPAQREQPLAPHMRPA